MNTKYLTLLIYATGGRFYHRSRIEEFVNAAEYIHSKGNGNIMLCERGIRTYEKATRNTLDISAVPILKQETHLPVWVDVTHSTGRKDLLLPTAKAAHGV